MIRRRSFLIGCGGVVAAPVFARLALAATAGPDSHAMAVEAAVSTAPVAAGPQHAVLRIDGWDSTGDSDNDVWIQINSSWRATWR